MFSVILPSYLGNYPKSASDKETKLKRSIESVLGQTFKEYELIVVSDGCDKTIEIAQQYDLNLYSMQHRGGWGGFARNVGISKAQRDWIIYIDSDDFWGKQHLEKVADKMCACEWKWYYFNDWVYLNGEWSERKCNVKMKGMCGTSNITHKRSLNIEWGGSYLHDWQVIQQLNKHKGKKIDTPEYYVLHIPGKLDI